MRSGRFAQLATLAWLGLVPLASRGDEQTVDLKDVPQLVREAADRAARGVKWTSAVFRVEDDDTSFLLKGTNDQGSRVEAAIDEEGEVQRVETALELQESRGLPAPVLKAAESAARGAVWTSAVLRTEDDETQYHLLGTDAKGRKIDVTIRVEVEVEVESELDFKDLPTGLADAIKPFSGVTWKRAISRQNGEETELEATGVDAKEHEVTVAIESDGKTTARTELEMDEVPLAVVDALKAKRPDFEAGSVELFTEKGVQSYRFEGEEDGEDRVVLVSPDGQKVEVEQDDEDDAL